MLNNTEEKYFLPKSMWKFYFNYAASGYWWMIGLWAICIWFETLNGVVQPLIQSWVVRIFEEATSKDISFLKQATTAIIYIVCLNLFITGISFVRAVLGRHWYASVCRKTSEHLSDYLYHQSIAFWKGRMLGQTQNQMSYILDGFDCFEYTWLSICRLSVVFINGTLLFSVNQYVAWVFIGVLIIRVLFSWRIAKPLKKSTEHTETVDSKLTGKIVDSISNYFLIKLFASPDFEKKRLSIYRKRQVDAMLNQGFWERIFLWVPDALLDITFGINIFLCAWLYVQGSMTVADVVLITGIYISVFAEINAIIDLVPTIINSVSSASKAYSELIRPIDIYDMPDAKVLQVHAGKIEFRDISFRYHRKWILKNFSLTINNGEHIGIVGASGSGKTTLVNLLMRLYDPQQGEILIDGQNIKSVTQNSLHKSISFMPQEPMMFNRSLKENIAYGQEKASLKQIQQAAKEASAHKFIMQTKNQYTTVVGDRGIELSYGQRQRISLARAFLKNAPILILDEATSAQDSENEEIIQTSFDKLAKGKTTIIIAHRLSTLKSMDRIVVIKDGKILEQGKHSTLLKKKGEYAKLWEKQSNGFLQ